MADSAGPPGVTARKPPEQPQLTTVLFSATYTVGCTVQSFHLASIWRRGVAGGEWVARITVLQVVGRVAAASLGGSSCRQPWRSGSWRRECILWAVAAPTHRGRCAPHSARPTLLLLLLVYVHCPILQYPALRAVCLLHTIRLTLLQAHCNARYLRPQYHNDGEQS